ncbi:hypothetical protein Tco_1082760 [Tanacetum coccineum]|uniref:Uncharacterized protein n=1 Tax=Tanacetum coccineum TaxID=301880 RepID=A0ABQ5I2T4_9ASTR
MITDSERSSLLECVVALKDSNTRLRDALGIKRVRADSLQRRLGYVEDELRQIHERRWLLKRPTATHDSLVKAKARMGMMMITEMDEMEIMVTIMGIGIEMEEMEVQEEMHQLLRLAPTRMFSIVNHTTLVVLKESLVWLDGLRKESVFVSVVVLQTLK